MVFQAVLHCQEARFAFIDALEIRDAALVVGLVPMMVMLAILIVVVLLGFVLVAQEVKSKHVMTWLGSALKNDWSEPAPPGVTKHLLFCFVDHFEPRWLSPGLEVEQARVARWRQDYPALCAGLRDADGRPPVHTFFYPEEEYLPEHLDQLVDLCREGLGEIEIHLHHDHDTESGLREKLRRFTTILVDRHDALPVDPVTGQAKWSFIHGNWALCNSRPDGRYCGVNGELKILRDEGCYADFTLPAAPDPCQTSTINKIYYAVDDGSPKAHDKGVRVEVGRAPSGDLMIVQGPLGFSLSNRKFGLLPRIENSDVRATQPPTADRIDQWVNTGIQVKGRPEWVIVKVHTHGAQERDMDTLLGPAMREGFEYLQRRYNDGQEWCLHYVSSRELYNIIKAAEQGLEGDPGSYRDLLIPRPAYREMAKA